MIASQQRIIDECLNYKHSTVRDDVNTVIFLKFPKWLKNTKWTVGEPYIKSSCITFNDDSFTIDVSDRNSETGLTMLYIDSTSAVKLNDEAETYCNYSVTYSTLDNTDVNVGLFLNKSCTSGKLSFVQYATIDVEFFITKVS